MHHFATENQKPHLWMSAGVEGFEFGLDPPLVHPLGQPLDAYEWLLFVAAHSERHTKQILEVKADPNFPKK